MDVRNVRIKSVLFANERYSMLTFAFDLSCLLDPTRHRVLVTYAKYNNLSNTFISTIRIVNNSYRVFYQVTGRIRYFYANRSPIACACTDLKS